MNRWRLFALGVGIAAAIAGVLLVVDVLEAERTDVAARKVTINACREGNLAGGYIRLVLERSPGFDARRLGLPEPDEALPILSCQETYEAGEPVRLRPRQEKLYLRVYARGRLPLVRDGVVVGSEPLPAPRRR